MLVEPPGSGRKALVHAWNERMRTAGVDRPLPGYRARLDQLLVIWEGNEADWQALATSRTVLVIKASSRGHGQPCAADHRHRPIPAA